MRGVNRLRQTNGCIVCNGDEGRPARESGQQLSRVGVGLSMGIFHIYVYTNLEIFWQSKQMALIARLGLFIRASTDQNMKIKIDVEVCAAKRQVTRDIYLFFWVGLLPLFPRPFSSAPLPHTRARALLSSDKQLSRLTLSCLSYASFLALNCIFFRLPFVPTNINMSWFCYLPRARAETNTYPRASYTQQRPPRLGPLST